jgi:hypothetical protein
MTTLFQVVTPAAMSKKDQTIPPSRSTVHQRTYIKSRYVSDLEERCRTVEEENDRLRREIDLIKAMKQAGVSALTLQTVCFSWMFDLCYGCSFSPINHIVFE